MEIVTEIKQVCRTCQDASKTHKTNVYCRLFGISIHKEHEGCKYWQQKGVSDAKIDEKPA